MAGFGWLDGDTVIRPAPARRSRDRSCWSRTTWRCSSRSSSDSTWPNIMVAVLARPSWWAVSITPIQSPVIAFRGEYPAADGVDQDFAATARDAAKPGGGEVAEEGLHRFVEEGGEGDEFRGTEAVDIESRVAVTDVGQEVEVPLLAKFRMVAALQEDLSAAVLLGFLHLPVEFLEGNDVGIGGSSVRQKAQNLQ